MKKVLYLLILIISLFIINNLVRSIANLWQKHDLISDAQVELQKAKNEHEKLQDQLSEVKRADFVESEARNKLFMVKPGEKVVILGGGGEDKSALSQSQKQVLPPLWKQWWELFF